MFSFSAIIMFCRICVSCQRLLPLRSALVDECMNACMVSIIHSSNVLISCAQHFPVLATEIERLFQLSSRLQDFTSIFLIHPSIFFFSMGSRMAFGSKGLRFDPRQQPFVQLSWRWLKQSHTSSWSLFSLLITPSFGWNVKPRPQVNRLTGAGSLN